MGVYIWDDNYLDYSAMRGPCPKGYHIPTYNEHVSLINIMQTLGIPYSTDYELYLHMPFKGGMRKYEDGSVAYTTQSNYWTCSKSSNAGYAWYLSGSSNSSGIAVGNNGYGRRAGGSYIRPFRDTPITLNSPNVVSFTKTYSGTADAGVYEFTLTSGEIVVSITADGVNWITIDNKNLGATTMYISGDTASEANCGNFYQWGNNYGFPFSGSITTSSTRVDASSYGPGNYYSSSTFITNSTNPADWSSVQNDNLWGGVTGVKHMSELKNAYIGEYHESFTYDFTTSDEGWTPSSGTLRDSNGFYRTGEWSDGGIEAPSEIFRATPKKIIISYNKTDTSTGTGIGTTQTYNPGYLLPYIYTGSGLNQMGVQTSGGTSYVNLGSNPTGNVAWEMDIDSTTTPRTITHSITGINSFTNNSGVLDSLFNDQSFSIRIVNWTTTGGLHITGVTIEY